MRDATISSPYGEELTFPPTPENVKIAGTLAYKALSAVLEVVSVLRAVSESEGKQEELRAYNAVAVAVIYLQEDAKKKTAPPSATPS